MYMYIPGHEWKTAIRAGAADMGGAEADEGQGVQHDWPVPTQGLSDARLQLWEMRGERRTRGGAEWDSHDRTF